MDENNFNIKDLIKIKKSKIHYKLKPKLEVIETMSTMLEINLFVMIVSGVIQFKRVLIVSIMILSLMILFIVFLLLISIKEDYFSFIVEIKNTDEVDINKLKEWYGKVECTDKENEYRVKMRINENKLLEKIDEKDD